MRRRINLVQAFVLLLLLLGATAVLVAVWCGVAAVFSFVLSNKQVGAAIFGALGLLIAARIVWLTVRRINRRHDPRHAKRPPDPP